MDKLGFTFYPKDWWTSDSYFDLTPIQRYYYLECLFVMYSNGGCMKTQKTQFENRIRTNVEENDWEMVVSKFILEDGNYTHLSVNKRLRKTLANRENGKKGGRPKIEEEKPKKPNKKTQKNPPSERESEIEVNNNKTKVDWNALLLGFNNLTKRNIRVVSEKTKNQITARLKEGYTKDDIWNAIVNCFNDDYHKETNHKYLTLEFISRPDKMEKYSADLVKKPQDNNSKIGRL